MPRLTGGHDGAHREATAEYRAYRIEATSTNRLAVVFDPSRTVCRSFTAVEIWDKGGAQPLNMHEHAGEIFYILKGRAVAHCDGRTFTLETAIASRPPWPDASDRERGAGRLYALCTMIPNDQFAELIRRGVPAELDAEDLAVLRRMA